MGQQRHGYFHSEPCVHFRGTNISMPNIYTVVSASGNTTNLDSHYILDACDNIRVAQYTVIQHQHNLDMGVPASANLYYSDTNPSSSTGVLPLPLHNRASDTIMGLQRYHESAARNRSGIRFPHPPPFNPQYHNFHHPTLPMQRMRGHSVNFHPPAASYRVPTNPSHGAAIPTENDFEMGARHVGTATLGHQGLPPMGFIQLDDVALLVDHHRDLRLDIEDMSYEELLAFGERIGNVSTCLSEERITTQMKTKTYSIPTTAINLEVTSEDICIICQDEYKIREKIGILQCGHEYHADCLKKWLLVKNVCPICKSEALTPGGKGV